MKKKIDVYLKEIFETIESFKAYDYEGYMNNTDGVDRINFQLVLVHDIKEIESSYFFHDLSDEERDNAIDFQIMCKKMIREISFALLHNYHMSTELVGNLFDTLYETYDYSYIINL